MDLSTFIGTAGWAIRAEHKASFSETGSHLERYAVRFNAVEVNSSFYRPHRRQTYERWAAATPPNFRFAVKLPRAITHERRLRNAADLLDAFAAQVTGLGRRLGVILIQLPPSLVFDPAAATPFFAAIAGIRLADLACEPRHPTWFVPAAERCLADHRIARVAADPAPAPGADEPAGWGGLVYRRLHGSPEMYYSAYDAARLDDLARQIAISRRAATPNWCIFDNTARGHATVDALHLGRLLDTGD